jgi:hypothetical protein
MRVINWIQFILRLRRSKTTNWRWVGNILLSIWTCFDSVLVLQVLGAGKCILLGKYPIITVNVTCSGSDSLIRILPGNRRRTWQLWSLSGGFGTMWVFPEKRSPGMAGELMRLLTSSVSRWVSSNPINLLNIWYIAECKEIFLRTGTRLWWSWVPGSCMTFAFLFLLNKYITMRFSAPAFLKSD